jgi:hypothetical protein
MGGGEGTDILAGWVLLLIRMKNYVNFILLGGDMEMRLDRIHIDLIVLELKASARAACGAS